MKRLILPLLLAVLCLDAAAQKPVWLDKSRSPHERAVDLTSRLTLDEKASLMRNDSPAVERLGIQLYNWWNEALHGVARNGEATMLPMPVGIAAYFDAPLLYKVFSAVSDEARIKYRLDRDEVQTITTDKDSRYKGLTFWTPNINIFRDPRWGRGMETYGEDPYLTGVLGCEVVRGLQGPSGDKLHACAKHYAVHSGPEPERHSFDAEVSERDLRETYLPAFRDLVTKADVQEIMFAYNSFRGEPCGASKYLLQDILRGEWGYKGIILSDCAAVSDFHRPKGHHFSGSPEEACAACVRAGGQLECGRTFKAMADAVRGGFLEEREIDECVIKLLEERFRLGEIDFDSPWDKIPEDRLCCEEFRQLSLQMTRESLVLLQNDGILPLAADAKIALVGPNAADSVMMWGNYNGRPQRTVTLLDALRERIPELVYIKGCETVLDTLEFGRVEGILADLEGIETVIFAGGISPKLEGEEFHNRQDPPGFRGGDRISIELPKVQRELIAALAGYGKKVILVNFSGSAIALEPESRNCAAILQAWYPGQEGGTAIAEVLFGDFNPCGKLPLTFYRDDSQLPPFENYDMAGRTYRFFGGKPLFPFGHGLSYTQFNYSKARVRSGRRLRVKVTNTSDRDGDEIVQMYISLPGDKEGPVRTLRAFKRVHVKAGRSKTVRLRFDADTFLWWNPASQRMEPRKARDFRVEVGGSSDPEALVTVS
ncbi:MAG: glycoside hydrolase family 3 C-terminal domain-containing protein [Bacteroidales bacterium]|nr:glycoside hydrolase family 3 C-terminal domain-containing protein [Bacteroidales bacterium]